MQTTEFDSLIRKYAILLSFIYLGQHLLTHFNILTGVGFLAYFYISNIVIALLVKSDLNRVNIKSPITVWSCVFFHLLGVVLLFLQLIRQDKKARA
jgi:hypothetical protein